MPRLGGLDIPRVDYVKRGAVRDPLNPSDTQHLLLYKMEGEMPDLDPVDKAEMSTDTRNNLPDSAFADPDARKFPHHRSDGSVDKGHLRNALSRVEQDPKGVSVSKVRAHLERHAEDLDIGEQGDAEKAESVLHRIHAILGDVFKADGNGNGDQMEGEAAQAIRSALDSIQPHLGDLSPDVQDAFDELAEATGYEAETETAAETEGSPATADNEPTQKGDEGMPEPEGDKNKKPDANLSKEELLKQAMGTLPVPVREMLEKQQADLAAANERVSKAEAMAKAERDIRLTADFVAKAEHDFGALPPVEYTGKVQKADGSGEEDLAGWAALAKSLSEKAPAEYAALEKALTTASIQIEKGTLFSEMGTAQSGGGKNGSSAIAKVEAAATVLRKEDPKLSKEQAFTKALENDPKLYKAYLGETEGAGRR